MPTFTYDIQHSTGCGSTLGLGTYGYCHRWGQPPDAQQCSLGEDNVFTEVPAGKNNQCKFSQVVRGSTHTAVLRGREGKALSQSSLCWLLGAVEDNVTGYMWPRCPCWPWQVVQNIVTLTATTTTTTTTTKTNKIHLGVLCDQLTSGFRCDDLCITRSNLETYRELW